MMEKSSAEKRETQKQNIITSFNMIGSQMQQMFGNPKFLMKAAYMSFLMFGAFHLTKLSLALIG